MIKHPKVKEKTFKKAIWLIIALQLVDLLTTFTFLTWNLPEGNPIFKTLVEQNFAYAIILKIIVMFIVVFFLFKVYRGRGWPEEKLKKSYLWINIDYTLNFIILIGLYIALHNTTGIVLHSFGLIY